MKPAAILLVEDEAIVALDLQMQLEDLGYQVVGVADHHEQAMDLAVRRHPDLVLMDVRLKGAQDGIATAAMLSRIWPAPVIYLTSHSDDETVRRAAETAPYGYLTKPFQIRELRAAIEVGLTKSRMERQLRESERWFASTLQCVHDGVIVTGVDGLIRFINPVAESLTGWAAEQVSGRAVGQVVRFVAPDGSGSGERLPQPSVAVQRALDEGRVVGIDHALRLVRRDGSEIPVDQSASPIEDDSGQRLGAVLVLRDASRRLQQEAQLRASEERFRSAFDHAPLGMALVALDGRFLQTNTALCRLLGRDAEALRLASHEQISWPADRSMERQQLHGLLAGHTKVAQFEKRYLRDDGREPLWALVSVSLLRDDDEPTCWLYQVHDLSEQKRAAEQVAELAAERMRREASEMADRAKTEFLSRASHEMRTPLNAVIGFAYLLQQEAGLHDQARARRYAQHIHAAGEHLLAMVNDVLDLQRAAQGSLRLQMAPIALAEAVDSACQLLSGPAQDMQIVFGQQLPPGLQVLADAIRMRQVLLNLGSNAVKYNRRGGRVDFHAEVLAGGRARLVVADTGDGLDAEQMSHLFQPFDRLGQERSGIPGTGLGLLIARNLVQQMGGTLTLDSTPGSGTRVTIELAVA